MSSGTSQTRTRNAASKRVLDVVLSGLLLVFAAPLLALLALAARVDTGASGVYRQERIGLHGRPFTIYKLRTMRAHAAGSTVTAAQDPRVTRFGALLRRYKLDELPQIWNVFRGDMSLVGPRATVREDYLRMTAAQRRRFEMKPGITGLAQINGNTALTWPERVKWDLEYVSHWSFRLDLNILLRTLTLFASGGLETHPQGDDEWA